jgi:DNA end-binding protein Ku
MGSFGLVQMHGEPSPERLCATGRRFSGSRLIGAYGVTLARVLPELARGSCPMLHQATMSWHTPMPARAIQSGIISFGLVSIPVKLYTAAASESVSFHYLHKKCGGRMKQQYLCPTEGEVVERSDMVRGYEYAKNQYVLFTEEELDQLESPKTHSLEILEFVPLESVDFLYIVKSYYLGPDKGGDKAYRLLADSMQRTERVAVGRFWTHGKEQLVLVRPYRQALLLHYVYYANEVRSLDEIDTGATFTFKPVETELADRLVEQLTTDGFHPERYHDDYTNRIQAAIEQKVAGQQITVAQEQPTAQIIDLFEALKRSLKAEGAPAETVSGPLDQASESLKPKPPRKAQAKKPSRAQKPATG